jgi:hypothetical protein
MQVAVWIVLAIVVAFVVIDAAARPTHKPPRKDADQTVISTQKIIVDLSKRR